MSMIHLHLAAIGALAITIGAIFALRPLAQAIRLVDKPGGHKVHAGEVPIVGGLGILLGTLFALSSSQDAFGSLQQYVFSAVLITVTGMIDDRFKLDHKIRLVVQVVALLPMFYGAHIQLLSFGDLLGTGPLHTDGWTIVATAIVVLGAINSFNMLDGLDGLAGAVSLSTLTLLLILCVHGGSFALPVGDSILIVSLIGSILGFLVFNAPIKENRGIRCFMGDAGSTLIGFSLAWLLIDLSQGTSRVAQPITMVWLTAIPITDLVWTVIRRLLKRKSPFHPDRGHLHHLLTDAGLAPFAVVLIMTSSGLLFGMAGLALELTKVPEQTSLLLWGVAAGTLVVAFKSAAKLRLWVKPLSAS